MWSSILMLPASIAFYLLIAWVVGLYYPSKEHKAITPRDMKGIDTITTGDSLYVIKFTIEKVMPDTIENQSQYKYDNEPSEEY